MGDIGRRWILRGEDTGYGGTAQKARPLNSASWLGHGDEVEVVPADAYAGAVSLTAEELDSLLHYIADVRPGEDGGIDTARPKLLDARRGR